MTRVPASSGDGCRGLKTPAFVALLLAASCGGAAHVTLPSGAGSPFPDFAAAYAESTAECRTVKTMSASLSLSGRAGSTKLSARIDAGFADSGRLRLEGFPKVGFSGKPFFVLVSRGADATLVLNRDARVLRGSAAVRDHRGADRRRARSRSNCAPWCPVVASPGPIRAQAGRTPTAGRQRMRGYDDLPAADRRTLARRRRAQGSADDRVPRLRVRASVDGASAGGAGARHGARGPHAAALAGRDQHAARATRCSTSTSPRDATPITLDELRRAGPLGDRR